MASTSAALVTPRWGMRWRNSWAALAMGKPASHSVHSAGRPSATRDAVSSRRRGAAASHAAIRSLPPSATSCSRLSSTSSSSPRRTSRLVRSPRPPSASPTRRSRSFEVRASVRSHSMTGRPVSLVKAARRRSNVVLPMPPGPTTVRRRASDSSTSRSCGPRPNVSLSSGSAAVTPRQHSRGAGAEPRWVARVVRRSRDEATPSSSPLRVRDDLVSRLRRERDGEGR